MKATFEFSLPEETLEYGIYRNALEYISALQEFNEWLRRGKDRDDPAHIDEVWDKFHEVCEGFTDDL